MAALDLCSEGEVSGIVVTKHHTVEVLPLRLSPTDFAVETITSRVNNLHLIRRIREGKDTEDSERTNSSSKYEIPLRLYCQAQPKPLLQAPAGLR